MMIAESHRRVSAPPRMLLVGAVLGLLASPTFGQDPASPDPASPDPASQEPGTLAVAEAADFLGDWQLTVDFQGQELDMAMSMLDEDGFVAATVASPQGTQRITDITRTDVGLDLAFNSQVGPIHLDLRLAGEELVGKLATESGGFEASLRGVRGTVDLEELATGGLFGSGPEVSKLEVAGGEVSIRLPDEEDSKALLRPMREREPDQLLVLPDAAAIKLRTDVDLAFGDKVVSGSLTESYPGVYSLWIVQGAEGWSLVVNREADIWGTQHQAEFDVVAVPLELLAAAEAHDALHIGLEEHADGGLIRASWQGKEWTAAFTAIPR